MMPFLNLLLTLLFLGSIVLIIYCIALVLARRSKQIRIRALKLAILPLSYVSAVLIYSNYKHTVEKEEFAQKITGRYTYNDSIRSSDSLSITKVELKLTSDKTFDFRNPQVEDSVVLGKWDLDGRGTTIKFKDLKGKLLWQGYQRTVEGQTFLVFNSDKQKVKFRKIQ